MDKPLKGLRVLEIGQLIAGPFCGSMLAGFGAEVVKLEKPGEGDPLRKWRMLHEGTSLWWRSMSRNKKSVTVNLRSNEGQEIARRLASKSDILIENFKPGTLEKWGLGYDELSDINPGIIMVRVSGYGQTGPYAHRPGYANVAEGFGGIRYTSGYPDRPPVRTGISLGDTLAGLHAAFGALTAVYHRDVNGGKGQVVDVSLFESVFNMMESSLAEFDMFGHVRERNGAKLEGIVPTSTYPTLDGRFIIIGGNGDAIFKRLMNLCGRPDLANDPALSDNEGRVAYEDKIDTAIIEWTSSHDFAFLSEALEAESIPAGPVLSIAEIAKDPHYKARGLFEETRLPSGDSVKIPAVIPKLSKTRGGTDWAGPELGQHNNEILKGRLGLSDSDLEELSANGVI